MSSRTNIAIYSMAIILWIGTGIDVWLFTQEQHATFTETSIRWWVTRPILVVLGIWFNGLIVGHLFWSWNQYPFQELIESKKGKS